MIVNNGGAEAAQDPLGLAMRVQGQVLLDLQSRFGREGGCANLQGFEHLVQKRRPVHKHCVVRQEVELVAVPFLRGPHRDSVFMVVLDVHSTLELLGYWTVV